MRASVGPAAAAAVAALAIASACAEPLELPQPPAAADAERAYDHPTAELSVATAERVLSGFLDQVEQLDQIGGLRPVVDALIRFDGEVTRSTDEDDPVVLIRKVPLRADALIEIGVDCPGWSDEEPVTEAVQLTVIARDSELVPIAWGPISDCKLEASPAGVAIRVELSGSVIAYLPTILDEDPESPRRIYIAYEIDALTINELSAPVWSGDFRLVGSQLELRIDVADVGHVVAFAAADPAVVGVRASNGEWRCLPDERRCERVESSSDSFSY